MLVSRTHAGTASRKRLRYICLDCQTNALLSAFRNSDRAERRSVATKTTPHTRRFQTSGRQWASVQTSRPSLDRSDTIIRKHLRAWSVENQKKKNQEAENAGGDSNKLRRLAALPNSLFIEDASSTIESRVEDDAAGADRVLGAWGTDLIEGSWNDDHQPGDLIWWRPAGQTAFARAQLALFLGTVGWQQQWMLADGRWVVEQSLLQASPAIRRFASEREVDQVRKHLPIKPLQVKNDYEMVLGYSFAGDVPAAIAKPLVTRFAQFADSMSTWRRENLALLDSLYDRIADEQDYVSLSFPDVASKLLGVKYDQVPAPGVLTIYRTLQRKLVSLTVVFKQAYHPSATVSITPKRLAKCFDQVCTWARQYQESAADAAMGKDVTVTLEVNPLSSFVAKARRLILKSRTIRSPTTIGSLGPSSVQEGLVDGELSRKENDETFTENDRMFIEFLWDCYIRYPPPESNRNVAIASLILRAIGAYPKLRLDANMGRLLLQELGTLPPWFLQTDHDVSMDLPHGRASTELKRIYAAADEFCRELCIVPKKYPGVDYTFDPNVLGDSMAPLRQDWGEMPVFCIDVAETNIREDGVSVELNPEIPGSYWIHGHVAHPTAFIDPEHIMAQRARLLTQAIFHHDRVARMLPDSFCKATTLGPNSPALTISTLLSEEGQVLDVKLRPTTLRNVIILSSAAVENLLGKPTYEMATLSLGTGVLKEHTGPDVSPADIETARKHLPTIQLLQKLLLAREAGRQTAVAVVPDWPVLGSLSSMAYIYAFGTKHHEEDLFRSQQYRGDPTLRISMNRYSRMNRVSDMASHVTVTALMTDLMAESAGKWFADRKIPAIFFGSAYSPNWAPERLNNAKHDEKAEYPIGKLSSSPLPHVHKMHESHLWISNPLRRYPDLMAHWNADCYLRAEAAGLVEPGRPADKLELPFTSSMCDEFVTKEAPKMYAWALVASRKERQHWITQALFRAFHFKEIELPEVWDLQVTTVVSSKTRPDDSGLRGVLLPFKAYAVVLSSEEGWEKGARRQSYLPVKLELVDVDKLRVVARVVGPPSDDYTQQGPIHLGVKDPVDPEPQLDQPRPSGIEGEPTNLHDGFKIRKVYPDSRLSTGP